MYLRIGAIALAVLSLGAISAQGSSSPKQEKQPKPEVQVRGPILAVAPMTDFDEQYEIEQDRLRVEAYLKARYEEELAAFYVSVQADLQRQADAAAVARRQVTSAPTMRISNGSGPHSDAWWWGVAICEQGGRNDPYFGFFSWMDGSAGGLSWEEQVAKSNALLSRVSSESPAWAPSCVAAGYRASPGG